MNATTRKLSARGRFLRASETSPEALSDRIGGTLAEFGAASKRVREVLCNVDCYCECCKRVIARGEVAWKWTRHTNAGGWRDIVACSDCPAPSEPAVRVSIWRVLRWNELHERVTRSGRRGRPALAFTPGEVELVRRLRADGLGEGRLASQFHEETGRRVSARRLASVGRD